MATGSRHSPFDCACPVRVDTVDKVGDEVASALICVFVDGLVAAPVGERRERSLMGNSTNAVRRGTAATGLSAAAGFDLQAS